MPPRLVLASASPRRQDLLRRLVPRFDVFTSDVEEQGGHTHVPPAFEPLKLPGGFSIPPADHPTNWAWHKARDVAERLEPSGETLILAADTAVILGDRSLGKPLDEAGAAEMLRMLRAREHRVATGCVLLRPGAPEPEPVWSRAVISAVWMRDYSEAELMGYVVSGEPADKAGAYAVQGLGGRLVERVEGCYFNVVGLPLCEVHRGLREAGVQVAPWPGGGYCDSCPLVSR